MNQPDTAPRIAATNKLLRFYAKTLLTLVSIWALLICSSIVRTGFFPTPQAYLYLLAAIPAVYLLVAKNKRFVTRLLSAALTITLVLFVVQLIDQLSYGYLNIVFVVFWLLFSYSTYWTYWSVRKSVVIE